MKAIILFSLALPAVFFVGCAGSDAFNSAGGESLKIAYQFPPDSASQVQLPKPTTRPDPIYPDLAEQAGISGTIVVEIWVNEKGIVYRSWVVHSGHPIFNKPAIDAVMKWHFSPLIEDSVPKPFTATIPFAFVMTAGGDFYVYGPR